MPEPFTMRLPPENALGTTDKKRQGCIPLDEVLDVVGFGWYNVFVVATAGLNVFASIFSTLTISFVLPATECDLQMTTAQKGLLNTISFIGMISTSHIMGYFADEYGRKYVALRSNFLSAAIALAACAAPNFSILAICLFIGGAATSGIIIPSYVFTGENTALKYRPIAMQLTGGLGNLPSTVLPILGIFFIPMTFRWDLWGIVTFNSWRLVMLMNIVPSLAAGIAFLCLYESPKFLLSKGHHDEVLKMMRHIYSINTGKSKDEFPVEYICIDSNEVQDSTEKASIMRIWTQSVSLFKKPLLKFTILSCIIQAGVVGACNIIYLWLPSLVNLLMTYSTAHPDYGATLCQVAQFREETVVVNSSDASAYRIVDNGLEEQECIVNVANDTYQVSLVIGFLSFTVFCLSGMITRYVSNRKLLVTYITTTAFAIGGLTLSTNLWITISFLGIAAVLLATSITACLAIVAEFFPTNVRSMATCMCMVCGRIATIVGVQSMGLLQESYCDISYGVLSVFLVGIAIIAYLAPTKQKKTADNELGER